MQNSIAHHHEPFSCDDTTDALLVVHVANSVAALVELDSSDLDEAPPIDQRALDQLGLSLDFIPDTVEKTRESVAELLRIFVN